MWALVILLGAISRGWAAEAVLPEGSAPKALAGLHFPDRVHEFVWRNWNAVEPAKLAEILGTSTEKVQAVADSMGLPPATAIPPEMKTRGYITLIRRNWHLLPYEQLLKLVGMTRQQLAVALREDDFLWVKLGMLKPKCESLHYVEPDESARKRAAEIKTWVAHEFGDTLGQAAEPRFQFVRQLGVPVAGVASNAVSAGKDEQLSLRFIYSYFAVFGDPLSNPDLDPFPDGLLQRLSALGVNGVWLHVVLRDLAPGGTAFPEFGEGHERRLATLRNLVDRAKKYGVGVYLYMNEPRAMPGAFFQVKGREGMRGVTEESIYWTLCSSNPTVRGWMRDSLTHVFKNVPDLAGVFTITASENLTNCASHYQWKSCPQCKTRSVADILVDVNTTIEEGVHRGNPKAKVLAWDWGWREEDNIADTVARLPKSIWLMSVSEWSLPIERGGIKSEIGEYSLSAVGPGPRAINHWKLAQQAGLKTAAKMQLNNTWELSSVPYLPVMDLVAEHCHNLASAGINGMLLSWSLGGYPSPNLDVAARFRQQPTPSIDQVLDAVAREHYGPDGAALARKAWTAFSTAFREYPFGTGLYSAPTQMGPANPLYLRKTGYTASMVGIPYDQVGGWCGNYPPKTFADQFAKIAEKWREGLPLLKAAVAKAPADRRADAEAELRFAEAACAHFQSVANQIRFVLARDALAAGSLPAGDRQRLRGEIRKCLESEIVLARQLFTLTSQDSRIGFEASNHYFYLPLDLVEKVINCRWLLSQFNDNDGNKE
jgi:hypothetical protein